MFFAHSENTAGTKHILKDHLESTADICRLFVPSAKFEQLFYLAGLVHDGGKFQDGFQVIG
jgi:CRISPR-associated endonuclease/helicase Cas3